jgi:hypothetical protein
MSRPRGLRRPDIDHQLELGRLQHRQVGGFLAPQNATHIDAGQAMRVREIRPVAQQTSGLGQLTPIIDRRNPETCCDLRQPTARVEKERIGSDEQRADALLPEARERRIELALAPGMGDVRFLAERARREPCGGRISLGIGVVRIHQQARPQWPSVPDRAAIRCAWRQAR